MKDCPLSEGLSIKFCKTVLKSAGIDEPLFCGIPCISIAIDSSRPVSINRNIITGYDEASVVVLESNWIRVVAPVVQIVG